MKPLQLYKTKQNNDSDNIINEAIVVIQNKTKQNNDSDNIINEAIVVI